MIQGPYIIAELQAGELDRCTAQEKLTGPAPSSAREYWPKPSLLQDPILIGRTVRKQAISQSS